MSVSVKLADERARLYTGQLAMSSARISLSLVGVVGVLMAVLLLRWFIVMGWLLWEKYH